MPGLTYQERNLFTSQEIEAKMAELGIPISTPPDSYFDEEEIDNAIVNLDDSYRWEELVTMKAGNYSPQVIIAYANLAEKMKGQLFTSNYDGLKIRIPTSSAQRRASALNILKNQLYTDRRDTAIRALMNEAGYTSPVE